MVILFLLLPDAAAIKMGNQFTVSACEPVFLYVQCGLNHHLACHKYKIIITTDHLTLGNVLSSKHHQRQGGPSQSHTCWKQQITLNVILIII